MLVVARAATHAEERLVGRERAVCEQVAVNFQRFFDHVIEGVFIGELSDPIPFDPTVPLPTAASVPAIPATLS